MCHIYERHRGEISMMLFDELFAEVVTNGVELGFFKLNPRGPPPPPPPPFAPVRLFMYVCS